MFKKLFFILGILGVFCLGCKKNNPKKIKPILQDGMVLIPAGNFKMGSNDVQARKDESPVHSVSVDAFWMDQTEVTNAEFLAFVTETGGREVRKG